jgi:two-component system, OmpR family, sensor histidine kinase BaeS
MLRSLWLKFLILLLGVAVLALSGTIVLRELMLKDFRAYLEGETEDKIYWIIADLEGAYDRNSGWNADAQSQNVIWAFTLGFEIRLLDQAGSLVIDTEKAIGETSPRVKRRLLALSEFRKTEDAGEFFIYPLFLSGQQIGALEARELKPLREGIFLSRSNRFLLLAILVIGGLAIILSILFSRRLTRPIKELALAASAISKGDFEGRVSTERRDEVGELSEAFNRMAQALEAHESLRRKLIADVAHELRTPLGVMRGELEGMMDGLIPNDASRLQSLHDETGRLKRIVDCIEELNQAEASVLSLHKQQFRVKPFLENITERYRSVYQEKGVNLELSCPDDSEINADPERLSQIIVNLLSNALRATSSGGRVSLVALSKNNELRISVEDTGLGIAERDLPFIFERFYHGPGDGLGIGLTIVKELAEAHGGSVEVQSARGKGSQFTVVLPTGGLHNSS